MRRRNGRWNRRTCPRHVRGAGEVAVTCGRKDEFQYAATICLSCRPAVQRREGGVSSTLMLVKAFVMLEEQDVAVAGCILRPCGKSSSRNLPLWLERDISPSASLASLALWPVPQGSTSARSHSWRSPENHQLSGQPGRLYQAKAGGTNCHHPRERCVLSLPDVDVLLAWMRSSSQLTGQFLLMWPGI